MAGFMKSYFDYQLKGSNLFPPTLTINSNTIQDDLLIPYIKTVSGKSIKQLDFLPRTLTIANQYSESRTAQAVVELAECKSLTSLCFERVLYINPSQALYLICELEHLKDTQFSD